MAFELGDYVTVADRLTAALEKYPDLRIVEGEPCLVHADGKVFIQAKMTVYRAWDDTVPMVGYIWEEFPGSTPYTRGSEQPNAATSVLGRILGYMGFGAKKSIASRDEVARAQERRPSTQPAPAPVRPKLVPVTYPNGDSVPDPFTDEQQIAAVYPPGDASKGQMGKIRALGRERGVVTNRGLFEAIEPIIGRKIAALDDLSKREATLVIDTWLPVEQADDQRLAATHGPLQDEEPF